MFKPEVVTRLLKITRLNKDKHIPTAFYAAGSANTCNFKYVSRYLDDESYLSRGSYKLEIGSKDVYFEHGKNYEQFKQVIASGYDLVLMMTGDEEENLVSIIKNLPQGNYMVFQNCDYTLDSYQILDNNSDTRELKRKSS